MIFSIFMFLFSKPLTYIYLLFYFFSFFGNSIWINIPSAIDSNAILIYVK